MTIVTFETSEGSFKAELFTEKMPITWSVITIIFKSVIDLFFHSLVSSPPFFFFCISGNFIDLVNLKYYDGLYIHRIAPEYCIQFGCVSLYRIEIIFFSSSFYFSEFILFPPIIYAAICQKPSCLCKLYIHPCMNNHRTDRTHKPSLYYSMEH